MVLIATKCTASPHTADWLDWYPTFVTSLVGGPVAAASTWALDDPTPLGRPGPGHTHVTRLDLRGPLPAAIAELDARIRAHRARGDVHPHHGEIRRDVWSPHTPQAEPPADHISAMITAEVLCTDPAREPEWDRWYDDQHLPDMLSCGAFARGSRWRRHPLQPGGANHLTVYEITGIDVRAAVEQSAQIMPDLIAAGRKHECHTGGLTMALTRV